MPACTHEIVETGHDFPHYVMILLIQGKIQRKLAEAEKDIDDQELAFKEMVEDLKTMIIYAKATTIKPWSWRKQRATTVTQMFSFGEPKAVELCTKSSTGICII